jgi:hypothetical protein
MIQELKELIGRRFSYKDRDILIKNVKKVNGVYVVLTDNKTYNFFTSEVSFFLKEIVEIPRVKVKPEALEKRKMELSNKQSEKPTTQIDSQTYDIKSVLIETIEKVRIDKTYVQQANTICNVVTQMINIQKLELSIKSKKS